MSTSSGLPGEPPSGPPPGPPPGPAHGPPAGESLWSILKVLTRLILALLGIAFFGMFCFQELTGHWWIFWIFAGVMLAGAYIWGRAHRRRRSANLGGDAPD